MEVVNNIVMKGIGEIKPYTRNPRRNEKTVELLCEIIPKVGFNVPIVIDHNGVIVKGHSRYKAAIRLGMQEVPCVVTDADEEAIRLDRIADNKVSEFSEWVDDALFHEIDMITADFDLSLLDFDVAVDDSVMEFDMDDFDDDVSTDADKEEARRKRFLEMQQSAPQVSFATEKSVAKAEERAKDVYRKEKAYKCVCEKCGHVQFVRACDVMEIEV